MFAFLRLLFGLLLLAVLVWSLMLWHNVLFTLALGGLSVLGHEAGTRLSARGEPVRQMVRLVLLMLTLAAAVLVGLRPLLEPALLAHCGFVCGLMIALTVSRRGRRSRWPRLPPRHAESELRGGLPVHPLLSVSAIVRSR